jgi:uncharacterized membrane protein
MSHIDSDVKPIQPVFSVRVRTAVYVVALIVTVLTLLALGLLVVLGVLDATTAGAALGVVTTACALLAAGFGVAYRPTRLPTP